MRYFIDDERLFRVAEPGSILYLWKILLLMIRVVPSGLSQYSRHIASLCTRSGHSFIFTPATSLI